MRYERNNLIFVLFQQNVLQIVDMILGLGKTDTQLWSSSLPIGSESTRIVKLVRHLSQSVYDFQRLNIQKPRDESAEYEEDERPPVRKTKKGAGSGSGGGKYQEEHLHKPYQFVNFRLDNISKIAFNVLSISFVECL
jgi:hypothetical protein